MRSVRYALMLALLVTGLYASTAQAGQRGRGPAPQPSFSIEKRQEIEGSRKGFTIWQLSGKSGQTVAYEIVVTNTGNVPLAFSKFTDSHCDAGTIKGGPGTGALAPRASATYTCDRLLSEAGLYINTAIATGTPPQGDGPAITRISNPVVVTVPVEPAFSIEKLQRIEGGKEGFTTATLTGAAGQTVEYEIIVTNTGNVPLTLSKFTDAHCATNSIKGGPGTHALAPKATTSYTCDRKLTSVGSYTNTASITAAGTSAECHGSRITHSSNTVEVKVPAVTAEFTITKQQEVRGTDAGFVISPLTGKIGDTIDYEIVVKNTGGVPLTFSSFTDANCDEGTIAGGPGESSIAPGDSTTYTCDHVLTTVGSYSNSASDTGTPPAADGSPVTHTSNTVVTEVLPEPAFTIEKLQEIKSGCSVCEVEPSVAGSFTSSELKGELGQTVDYEIIVSNTGNVPLKFSEFTDANCDEGTIAGGPGEGTVAPAESTTYTCDHVLTAVGAYSNSATDTGTPPSGDGSPLMHTSNTVVTEVTPEPGFSIEKVQEIAGSGAGFTTSPLTGSIGQVVDYEIYVTNTGNVPLTFSEFTDANCEKLEGGPGAKEVAPRESTTYTCDQALSEVGSYSNSASDTGTPPAGDGSAITISSNTVVTEVAAPLE